MAEIKILDCHHIPAQPSPEDIAFLETADVIMLAGGEVRQGWDAFAATGVKEKLMERYYAGALLIGLSAGAIQLGLLGWEGEARPHYLEQTKRLRPYLHFVSAATRPDFSRSGPKASRSNPKASRSRPEAGRSELESGRSSLESQASRSDLPASGPDLPLS